MAVKTHKDLDVWKLSMDLVESVYRHTRTMPGDEAYGLTAQLRRSAVSVPTNIAEGAARQSRKEYIRFLYIGLGSLSELETLLLLSDRLGHGVERRTTEELIQVRKKLLALIKSMKAKDQTG